MEIEYIFGAKIQMVKQLKIWNLDIKNQIREFGAKIQISHFGTKIQNA